MSRTGHQSDSSGGPIIGLLVIIAVLWWLRWIIVAAAVITALVLLTRWATRRYRAGRAAEQARLDAIRRRADIQNAQVLRGDPAGFFGAYRLPDPELIPAWYAGSPTQRPATRRPRPAAQQRQRRRPP